MRNNRLRGFAKGIGNDRSQLDVGNSQGVLHPILLAGSKAYQLEAVAQNLTQITDLLFRNEAARDQVVLEQVGNPDGVFFIGLLAPDRFDTLGVCQSDLAGRLKDVVDRDPVLAGGLHADMQALVIRKPLREAFQIFGESGETFGLVGCDTFLVCGRDGCHHKGFVDIDATADGIDDLKHKHFLPGNYSGPHRH